MGAIYLIRHAQASFEKDDYDQLSELGHRQSRILGEVFTARHIVDAVISGSMRRHLQTAQGFLAFPESSQEINIERGFNEFNHKDLIACLNPEWKNTASLSKYINSHENPRKTFETIFIESIERWISGHYDEEYQESWSSFKERVIHSFETLKAAAGRSNNIFIFTSGGPISVICQWLLKLNATETLAINENLANTGVTRLLYDRQRVSLSYLNNYSHLEHISQELVTFR